MSGDKGPTKEEYEALLAQMKELKEKKDTLEKENKELINMKQESTQIQADYKVMVKTKQQVLVKDTIDGEYQQKEAGSFKKGFVKVGKFVLKIAEGTIVGVLMVGIMVGAVILVVSKGIVIGIAKITRTIFDLAYENPKTALAIGGGLSIAGGAATLALCSNPIGLVIGGGGLICAGVGMAGFSIYKFFTDKDEPTKK